MKIKSFLLKFLLIFFFINLYFTQINETKFLSDKSFSLRKNILLDINILNANLENNTSFAKVIETNKKIVFKSNEIQKASIANSYLWFLIIAGIIVVTMLFINYIKRLKYTLKLEKEVKDTNKELMESQIKYKSLFEDNLALMIIIDPESGNILDINKVALVFYNYNKEDIIGKSFREIDSKYQSEYFPLDEINLVKPTYYVSQHRTSTKETKHVELTFSLISDGATKYLYTIIHDIKEKKETELAYKESEERYRILINNMKDGVFVIKNLKIFFANTAMASMIGCKLDELIGVYPKRFIHNNDLLTLVKSFRALTRGIKLTEETEFRIIHQQSKNLIYVLVNMSLINYSGNYAILGTVKNITIRKRQDEQLRKLSTAVEQSPISIIITDVNGNIEYVNPKFLETTGYTFHEIFKQNPRILKSGLMEMTVYEKMWRTILSGKVWQGELINKRQNGETFWVSSAISPIKTKGVITHFLATQMDITFEKYAQQEIQSKQKQISSIINNLPIILFNLDSELKIKFIQGKGLENLKVNSKNIVGKSLLELFAKYPEIIFDLNEAKNGNSIKKIRKLFSNYYEIFYQPVFEQKNTFLGINGFAYDITSRYKAEQALAESEERFRSLYENSTIAIYRSNLKGEFIMANPKLLELLGYNNFDELKNIKVTDDNFAVKYDRTNFLNQLEKDGFVRGFESVWIHHDGKLVYIRESAKAFFDANHRIDYIDGVVEDITEKKIAEKNLINSEQRIRAMLSAIPDIIIEINISGFIINCHSTEKDSLELGIPINIINKNLNDIFDDSFTKNVFDLIYFVLEKNEIQFFEHKNKMNNIENYYEVRIVKSGTSSFMLLIRNITLRKESEKMLIHAKEEAEKSDKLKTEFLAQMSHEIRTPINAIMSFTSLIKEELVDKIPEELKLSFEVIDNGGMRLIRTIDSILNMSQLQTGTYEASFTEIDLNSEILIPIINELKSRAKSKKILLNYHNKASFPLINGDNYTLGQIFVNLIDNAIKYTNKGEVSVYCYDDNDIVFVEIIDTGIGISKEYIPNLFKPFTQEESGYTRKFEGNGLGLALVQKYLDINNAGITVDSLKDVGTTFKLYFKKTKKNL